MSEYIDLTQNDDAFIVDDISECEIETKYNSIPERRRSDAGQPIARHSNAVDKDEHDGEVDTCGIQIVKQTPVANKGRTKDAYGGKQFRWWFLTWNNPEHPEDKQVLLGASWIQYVKFQYEKGISGTKHYQGVFYSKKKITCSWILKKLPRCGYLAPVKDTKGAVSYCGKAESRLDGPWEHGTMPSQGRRSDLLECKEIIDAGGRMESLFEQSFSNAVRYGRGLKSYIDLVDKKSPRTWQTNCYIYFGDAGMGKTEAAKEETLEWGGKTFWMTLEAGMGGKVWWDGYDGEENIVIDEFEQQIRLSDFKRIIDSSPFKVPVKGGYVEFKAKRVWFISNLTPDTWYLKAAPGGTVQRNALQRRMHYCESFLSVADGGHGKFQGQPDYASFLDSRRSFVEAQVANEYNIHSRPPGVV